MYRRFFKRFIDIFLSAIALVVLSPIIAITAILVAAKLGRPVIYKAVRAGKDGKPFTMCKFRSMSNATDSEGNLLPDTERLTKFGRMIRALSIDELPELWNILKGDMSIIGPRPLPVSYLKYYNDNERKRHKVRGGLTGLAQVNGRNSIDWEEKFKYDIQYVDNITFVNDVKIFFKTIGKVLKRSDIGVRGEAVLEDFDVYRERQWAEGRIEVENNENL